ncbi:hypothetical protein BGX29_012046 [Mortierella sp. GBA35]|nr:hypothetical protein BGX29_012046 [Mortierella sp. GBA35]
MGPVAEMEPLNEEPPDKLVPYQTHENTDTGDVYKWIDTIALGTFGTAVVVTDVATGAQYYLKIQKRAQSHQQNVDVLERIDNGHEGIIRYYDQFEYMGHYCLRLDLAQTNLLKYRKDNPNMTKKECVSLSLQIA